MSSDSQGMVECIVLGSMAKKGASMSYRNRYCCGERGIVLGQVIVFKVRYRATGGKSVTGGFYKI